MNLQNKQNLYITYKKRTSAKLAMLSIENFKINDQEIKTYLGLTRLCKHFFNNSICFNKEKCNYKHSLNF